MRPRLRVGTAVLLVILVSACGTGPAASPSPTALPSTPPSPSPNPSADVAVVRIEQTGGMLPLWETLRWYPTVALYADGRLIVQGPVDAMYPSAALPNLLVTQLTQSGVEQALAWAADAGLAGEDRTLGQAGFDSGETVFTVVHAAGTHRTSVADMSSADSAVGALREFQDILLDLHSWLPGEIASAETGFESARLRLISFPADPTSVPDHELSTIVDWPLDPIASLGNSFGEPAEYRCALVEGSDLAALWPMLREANELTLWRSADVTYQVYAHPMLPDDEACPGL